MDLLTLDIHHVSPANHNLPISVVYRETWREDQQVPWASCRHGTRIAQILNLEIRIPFRQWREFDWASFAARTAANLRHRQSNRTTRGKPTSWTASKYCAF